MGKAQLALSSVGVSKTVLSTYFFTLRLFIMSNIHMFLQFISTHSLRKAGKLLLKFSRWYGLFKSLISLLPVGHSSKPHSDLGDACNHLVIIIAAVNSFQHDISPKDNFYSPSVSPVGSVDRTVC